MIKAKMITPKSADFASSLLDKEVVIAAATLVIIAILALLSIYRLNPPDAGAINAPVGEFSSARAMEHVKSISEQPHPLGSAGHAAVRDYIRSQLMLMGLSPEMQTATSVTSRWGRPFRAAMVENIIVKLEGAANAKAILLVGHYDSANISFGASDDGAAVAAMLETLRALKASSRLKNDVMFLFTDGEEPGLLGAKAFVDEHPWAKDVGVVFNFEARGNSGPSIMFETSNGNGGLIKEFARSGHHPVANSLSSDIYKLLPNDTDFTVFRSAGLSGLNFAYIEGLRYYHSSLDNAENIDERSLQHHGLQALALARHFGDLNYEVTKGSNAVYFDVLSLVIVHYSMVMAFALSIFACLLTVGVVVMGFRKGLLTFQGIAKGFLATLLSMLGAVILTMLLTRAIAILHRWVTGLSGDDRYHDGLYMLALIALTIALTSAVYAWFLRRVSVKYLSAGALLWFLILMILSIIYLPGGSYILTWPLLFGLFGLGYTFIIAEQRNSNTKQVVALFLAAVPGVVLFAPMIFNLFVVLGINLANVIVVMTVLVLGLLVTPINFIVAANKWLLPVGSALAAVCLILAALLQANVSEKYPRLDSIFYVLNSNSGRAVWASADDRPDEWTSQFLSEGTQRGSLNEYMPGSGGNNFLQYQAPVAMLAAPDMKLLEDKIDGESRDIRMRIVSPRNAAVISVYVNAEVAGSWINGKRIEDTRSRTGVTPAGNWALLYWAPPPEGIELKLKTKPSEPLNITLVDQSYQLPELSGVAIKERPSHIKPHPFSNTGSTFVSASFPIAALQ